MSARLLNGADLNGQKLTSVGTATAASDGLAYGTAGGFFLRVLIYTAGAYPARPATGLCPAGYARYIGPTQPTDWLTGDEWINNS